MIVISTTGNPPLDAKARCLASVPSDVQHIYLDMPERLPEGFPHFPALIDVIASLPDDEIVCSLDGDDWLKPGALDHVQRAHDAGALVTYGSFEYSDGRPGFARQLEGDVRTSPWVTTHLKTFRAGLFKRIRHEHLKTADGFWLERARDHALMMPLVEMAGDRAVYIPEVLYVYNGANSEEFRFGVSLIAAEITGANYVRSLPAYERI